MAVKAKKIKLPKFNSSQQEVIKFKEGPLIVVAVAGAGKTTVLTYRIKELIKSGVNEDEILATTFTKKAATEMNERLKQIGVDTTQMKVSTFHSVAYSILRSEIPEFSKLELDSTGRLEKNTLKEVLGFKYMNWNDADLGTVTRKISNWKNSLIRPFEARDDDYRYVKAYELFEQLRKDKKFITFDDMLIRCWELFKNNQSILNKYQMKYKYVMVDECQDNNLAQHELTRMLSAPQNNVMIVGDDDQSIYKFRGAVPEFMINFQKEFNAKLISMEDNYRCKQPIIDWANKLIKNNATRIQKQLKCNIGDDGKIEIYNVADPDEEATFVKDKIKELIADGVQYKDIAVLYRMNAQSRSVEDQMIIEGIPYELVGGINFYNRKEIKDILAYINGALGLGDVDEHLRRIINIPFRYLGKAFIDTVEKYMMLNKCSFEEALNNVPQKSNQMRSIREFNSILDFIRINKDEKPDIIIQGVIDKIRYIDFLKKDEGEDEDENSRIMNVRELVRAATKFNTIFKFLEYIKKMQKRKKKKDKVADKVVLSTIHRSKGLEWENVFIIGFNDGILPFIKNIEYLENGEVRCEEERRLAYVAGTRAKKRLYITYCNTFFDKTIPPSRFITETDLMGSVQVIKRTEEEINNVT